MSIADAKPLRTPWPKIDNDRHWHCSKGFKKEKPLIGAVVGAFATGCCFGQWTLGSRHGEQLQKETDP
jgi:hypothetical protein